MKFTGGALISLTLGEVFANEDSPYRKKVTLERRDQALEPKFQCVETDYEQGDTCTCMGDDLVPPDDSTCWQWWTPPPNGILAANDPPATKGCDYEPCETAVCTCDPYCCDTAWDQSCRGYKFIDSGLVEDNWFVQGCSASILCCEPESAFPDFLPEAASPPPPETADVCTGLDYVQGNMCPCMEGNPVPPDDSTCWQWWTPPPDGVLSANDALPTKGCDYAPCEKAVCDCDDYCCQTAWDESCRGYKFSGLGQVEDNYFVQGCSASILCCEPESASPDYIIGNPETNYNYYPVPVPGSQINYNYVPVPNPVPELVYNPIPNYVINPVPVANYVPIPVSPAIELEAARPPPPETNIEPLRSLSFSVNYDCNGQVYGYGGKGKGKGKTRCGPSKGKGKGKDRRGYY